MLRYKNIASKVETTEFSKYFFEMY